MTTMAEVRKSVEAINDRLLAWTTKYGRAIGLIQGAIGAWVLIDRDGADWFLVWCVWSAGMFYGEARKNG